MPRVGHEILSFPINIIEGCVFGGSNMKDLGTRIYWFGCVVAATVLGIGVADCWFGHQLTAFLSWAVLASIPWLVGRASLYVLARYPNAPAVKREAEENWGR